MIRVLLDKNSKVLSTLQGSEEFVELNTADAAVYVDMDDTAAIPDNAAYYEDGLFITPTSTDSIKTFDYKTKQWLDLRTIDDVKQQKWLEIKAQRDSLEFGGFEFGGDIYDSNQVSQGRIMGAASAGVDQIWTLADNSTKHLTAIELQHLYQALQLHVASAHERGRIARQLIQDAKTIEEVERIKL